MTSRIVPTFRGRPTPTLKNECDHDWRVQPGVILPTYPPRVRLMCAKCRAVSSASSPARLDMPDPTDPRTWPKWRG